MEFETIMAISPATRHSVKIYKNIENFYEDGNCLYFRSCGMAVSIPKCQFIIECVIKKEQ